MQPETGEIEALAGREGVIGVAIETPAQGDHCGGRRGDRGVRLRGIHVANQHALVG